MRRPFKKKHTLEPDHKYNSLEVSKLISYVMQDGKKGAAEKIVYGAFDEIKKQTKREPLEVYQEALVNIGPTMEVRSRRVGGANYQVPYEVRPERKLALALRWIVGAAQAKSGTPMYKRLANELIGAINEEGEAFKKRENMHKMANANKAFAHFAFNRSKKKKKLTL